jgi:hypothetical protein
VDGEKMDDINGVLRFQPEQKISMKIGKRKFALIEMSKE